MSENAEENDTNQSKFYRVLSSEPVTDTTILFDTIEKFLTKDKKRQLSSEYLDEKDQIASRLTWNNLRNVANSVLDEDSPQRTPIPAWIEQKEPIVVEADDDDEAAPNEYTVISTKEESIPSPRRVNPTAAAAVIESPSNSDSANDEEVDAKKEAKKAEKEAKKARKQEREAKREAKKAKKEAKKIKKEAKKRKRDDKGEE